MFLLPPSAFVSDETQSESHTHISSASHQQEELLSPQKFISSTSPTHSPAEVSCAKSPPTIHKAPPTTHESRQSKKSRKGSTVSSRERTDRDESLRVREISEEMDILRRENYRLMEENLRKTYSELNSKSPDHRSHQQRPLQTDNKHIDSLISKQAEEINSLKQQLHDSKIDYERSLSELQSHSICRDRDNQLEISEMTSRHELTLDQLKQRHEEMIEELKRNVKQIDRDNTKSLESKDEEIDSLREEMRQLQAELENKQSDIDKLHKDLTTQQTMLRKLEEGNKDKDSKIQQLQSENQTYKLQKVETLQWPQLKAQLETRIKATIEEKDTVCAENEALNLRLSAIDDILVAQQNTLRTDTTERNLPAQEKLHYLLTKWRSKVHSLLVQQKSAEILTKASGRKWAESTRLYEGQIRSLTNQNRELECELREREAQITLLTKYKQNLELSTQQIEGKLKISEESHTHTQQSLSTLRQIITQMADKYEIQCRELQTCDHRLSVYYNELDTANNKLTLLQGVVQRHRERSDQCENLTERLNNSELVKQDLTHKVNSLEETLLTLSRDLDQRQDVISGLTDRLDVMTHHSELETQRIQIESERVYKDEISQYQCQISDLKRELAKTIVSLRQLERRYADVTLHNQTPSGIRENQNSRQIEGSAMRVTDIVYSSFNDNKDTYMKTTPDKTKSPPSILTTHNQPADITLSVSPRHSITAAAAESSDTDSVLGSVRKLAHSLLISDSEDEDVTTCCDDKENQRKV